MPLMSGGGSGAQTITTASLRHLQAAQDEAQRLRDVESQLRRETTRLADACIALEQELALLREVPTALPLLPITVAEKRGAGGGTSGSQRVPAAVSAARHRPQRAAPHARCAAPTRGMTSWCAEPTVESLEAELTTSSKEDILGEWRRVLEDNRELQRYIDRMLALVIVTAPQLLERRADRPSLPS